MKRQLNIQEEVARCLLCNDAPCSKVCSSGDPARAIRAIRFGNADLAKQWIIDCDETDLAKAENACIHYDRPIRINEIAKRLPEPSTTDNLPSLEIEFCGLKCENPFFLASSAVCTNYEMVARAFEAGWAGVFYKTICLDDINEVSPRFDSLPREGDHGDFVAFRNMEQLSENPAEVDFDILHRLKQNYPSKIVVASIMGSTEEQWIELAKMAEAAGVDAIELNFSCPQMRIAGMGSDVGQNSELVLFYTAYVKNSVSIPVIPKMTPNITNMTSPAMAAFFAKADAISAINTIKSVTMSDDAEVNGKKTVSGLSGRAVKPIALRFILEMTKNKMMTNIQYSGIGGIETWHDALEFIQLGCRNVQVCTAIMQYGYRIIDDLVLGLQHYMASRGVNNLADLVGEQLPLFVRPSNLDRTTMVFPVIDRELCIGCGRCYISCEDGGHQAITFDENRRPQINGKKCVGCHLCRLVCPTAAISTAKRINKRKITDNVTSQGESQQHFSNYKTDNIKYIEPNPKDRIIFINIRQTYKSGERENLYEATRKYWRLNGKRAEKATHVLAIVNGIVLAVFKPRIWYVTDDTRYKRTGRWVFEGVEVPNSPYIGKSMRNLLAPSQNPIQYYNM